MDNTLTDIVNQLTSAQTTALAARGSSQTQAQRDAASNELLAIRDALMSDINTKFQGAYLFSGSKVTIAAYASSGGVISAYQGDSNVTSVEIEPGGPSRARSTAARFSRAAIRSTCSTR